MADERTVEKIAIVLYCIDLFLQRKVMANSKENQARAEAQFHKTIKKAQEAKQAMSQYEADARAVAEKTAKLRALRLAKEAADKELAEKNTHIKETAICKHAKRQRDGRRTLGAILTEPHGAAPRTTSGSAGKPE